MIVKKKTSRIYGMLITWGCRGWIRTTTRRFNW